MYEWLKIFHLFAVFAWMAGLFYLPRLFAYHVEAGIISKEAEIFKIMEKKLLKVIMNPAMILSLIFGIWLAVDGGFFKGNGWIHVKMTLVFIMILFHMWLGKQRKLLENNSEKHCTVKTYKLLNEVPTVLLFGILILAVLKPF